MAPGSNAHSCSHLPTRCRHTATSLPTCSGDHRHAHVVLLANIAQMGQGHAAQGWKGGGMCTVSTGGGGMRCHRYRRRRPCLHVVHKAWCCSCTATHLHPHNSEGLPERKMMMQHSKAQRVGYAIHRDAHLPPHRKLSVSVSSGVTAYSAACSLGLSSGLGPTSNVSS